MLVCEFMNKDLSEEKVPILDQTAGENVKIYICISKFQTDLGKKNQQDAQRIQRNIASIHIL